MTIVAFEHVYKSFDGNRILIDTSVGIEKGETLTIIGGSGTGKSVFLKLLLGVMAPDRGQVLFEEKDVHQMNEDELIAMRRTIGMLFQGAALFDSLTVGENVAYPLREHFSYSDDEVERLVHEKLSMVGLSGIETMMPADLSGGMRKRVALARAIATKPKLILYDEPTTGLDPANTKRIGRLIVDLQQKLHVTSVVVTHEMELAFSVSHRIALLHGRKFAFVGTPDEARRSLDPFVQHFIRGEMETVEGGA